MAEPTEDEILAQQLAHLDEEPDRVGNPTSRELENPDG